MGNGNVIRTDGILKRPLEEYRETYEQWKIYCKNKTGKATPVPDNEVLLVIAIRDEIRMLKELMAGEKSTLEECQTHHELFGLGVILNDGKLIGYEEKADRRYMCRS